ncbi:hypothetical protein A0H81_14458 [Grifola frondosa]|uniref:Uncharacterized protein n=1 Tax=Grifola frondosa TaxID=5627 RepID=A0A1C7LS06_GRIFR|nr:hypothetical protein A0H81_14458 [Grifola frondosa]
MKHAEDLVLSFLFEVSRNDSIYNVQEAIWNARPEVVERRCDPAELVLYKLRPPEHPPTPSDYRKRQEAALSEHTQKLDGTSRVSDCFAEYDPDLLVPILIGVTYVRRGSVVEDHILAVKRGVLAREPSSAAQYVHLLSEQQKGPIKNGRPADQSGLPLAIYHPVFAKFKDLCADQNIRPSASENALAHQLFAVAASIYDDEDARFKGMQPTLEGLLNDAFDPETRVCNTRNTRCLLTETRSSGFALRAVVEVKNEIGTGLCDPSIEGGMYYRKYWVQPSMEPVLNACCCPSFVISVAGPWICVLGAVFVDHVIVQPLTEYISLGGEPDYERRVSAVARIFHLLSGCMHDLNMFYGPLEVSDTLISSRLFPCFTCYSSGGTEVRLVYEYALLGKAVFLALTQHGEAVVVKFTESYCKAAHLLLAEHGLAPPCGTANTLAATCTWS